MSPRLNTPQKELSLTATVTTSRPKISPPYCDFFRLSLRNFFLIIMFYEIFINLDFGHSLTGTTFHHLIYCDLEHCNEAKTNIYSKKDYRIHSNF